MEPQRVTKPNEQKQAQPAPSVTSQSRESYHPFLELQQAFGNQAVQRLIQAKLEIGQSGDRYEREADRVADAVMQRLPSHKQERGGRSNDDSGSAASPHLHGLGSGRSLSKAVRAQFEEALGWDFSGVRLHTGTTAMQAADSVGAKAFTMGRDIVFGNKVDNPESSSHRWLLAHELAHVVQQEKGTSHQLTQPGPRSKSSETPLVATAKPLAASLSATSAGQAQALPLVTAVAAPGELGVGRQIRATATVAPGAGPLTWDLVGAPAGVTRTESGRTATIRSAAAPNPHPAAGTAFTVRAARRGVAGDNAVAAVTLVGITNVTLAPVPAFANQGTAGGGVAVPPVPPAPPALGGVADPNRGGLVGNTVNVVVVTAPAGRANTVTLPRALGAAIAGGVVIPGRTTGNARVRVMDNATRSSLDVPLVVQPVPLFLGGFGPLGAAPAGTYGALYPLRFRSSDSTGVLDRVVGETITPGGRNDFGFPINPGVGPNPAPVAALAVPANNWVDQLLRPIGDVVGAAGDANPINVNRHVGPGVAIPLPAIESLRQGFHFQGWGGAWSDEFDHGLHVRSLRGRPGNFIFRTEFPFSRVRGPVQPDLYAGPPLIVLSAITLNTAAAPAVPLAAGGLAADGVALGGVGVASPVAGRTVDWSVVSGPIAFTVGAAAAPVAAAATLQAGLVAGNFRVRVSDTVFPNRRVEGNVRVVAVTLRGITAPVRTIPAGILTAIVNVTANPGGRAINWAVDPAAAAAGVTVVGTPVAGAAAAAAARSATVNRPAGFTGRVTATAADSVLPAKRASIVINFR